MMIRKHLSPAFVVALIALFVALSGTAVAAGIVPLATAGAHGRPGEAGRSGRRGEEARPAGDGRNGSAGGATARPGELGSRSGVGQDGRVLARRRPGAACSALPCGSGEKALSGGFDTPGSVLLARHAADRRRQRLAALPAQLVGDGRVPPGRSTRYVSASRPDRRIQAAAAALCALATTIAAAWLASAPGDGSGRLRDVLYAAPNGLVADAGRAPTRKRRSLAWHGGPLVAASGEQVTVYVSDAYPPEQVSPQVWADFFRRRHARTSAARSSSGIAPHYADAPTHLRRRSAASSVAAAIEFSWPAALGGATSFNFLLVASTGAAESARHDYAPDGGTWFFEAQKPAPAPTPAVATSARRCTPRRSLRPASRSASPGRTFGSTTAPPLPPRRSAVARRWPARRCEGAAPAVARSRSRRRRRASGSSSR